MKRVALHTLGCKLNFSETSTIGSQFLNKDFTIVDFKQKADVYVLNTCSVTENAEKECRQIIRKALRINPEAFIIVTGCYAQLRPEEISAIEGVDIVLGSNEKFNIFSLIDNFNKKDLACVFVSPTKELNDFGFAHSTDADSRTRAYFKVQDGCDYKCSFCTIPAARGGSRSMNVSEAISEFSRLVEQGYREIILTGVNVGDYGKSAGTDFYNLLVNLSNINGDFRIRISSIEPNLLTDDILNLVAENEKLCKHFHIPLQSGSPKILKLMQRRYKADFYNDLILKAKQKIKNLGVGVDVIVGYPGETEDDFLQTYNFINELPVSYLHVFTYSERPGTKAINLPGKVDMFERRRRNNMLRILSEKKKNFFYNEMIGKELDVLFESEASDGKIKGFSSNYVRVVNTYDENLINEFSKIKITEINDSLCEGKILEIKKSIDSKAG
jgi:threonylcarbamoyladenosine tRNA methylthiotransferase MtaB